MRFPAGRLALFTVALHAGMAAAQSPPSLIHDRVDGAALAPGTWTYDIIARLDREEQKIGTRALMIEPATHQGRAAWRVIERSRIGVADMVDTVILDRSSMRPLHRSLLLGSARLSLDFTGDSAAGSIQSGSRTTPFAARMPSNAVISAGMLEALLRVSGLGKGWSTTANLAVVGAAGNPHVSSTALSVTGQESTTVPAGTFPTWVALSVGEDGKSQTLWLSRDGGWLIRSVASMAELPGAAVETVLVGHAAAPR